MIQRVQSIYLLLAIVFSALTLALPLLSAYDANGNVVLTITSLTCDSSLPDLAGHHPYGILATTILSIVCPLVAIFKYKNRRVQTRWVSFCITANVLTLLSIVLTAYSTMELVESTLRPEICSLLPVLAIIANLMARRGILRDEALIRAADRIR